MFDEIWTAGMYNIILSRSRGLPKVVTIYYYANIIRFFMKCLQELLYFNCHNT